MDRQLFTGEEGRFVRRYEYDDEWVVAADVGLADDAIDVDVVDRTAIVVVETADGVAEAEFDLPGPAANVDVNNGVLVITGDR
ncbi:MAG: Hsp20/alpha crystallin family protein [Haloferacaceae archaeon]